MPSSTQDGLFNLLDDNRFCQALCCGPCLFGANEKWFRGKETLFAGKEEQAALFWLAFSPLGFLTNWMCVSGWHMRERRGLVELKGSDESECASCCYVTCCSVCSLAQINREMSELRKPKPGSNVTQRTITRTDNEDGTVTEVTSAPQSMEMSVAGVPQHAWRTTKPARARNGEYTSIAL